MVLHDQTHMSQCLPLVRSFSTAWLAVWLCDGLQAADTYVLDPEMAAQLRASNPQAFRNVLGRCLEAHGRGMWQPKEDMIERLRKMYGELDDELEGIK